MRNRIPSLLAAAVLFGGGLSFAFRPAAAETSPAESPKAPKALSVFSGVEDEPALTLRGADARQQIVVTGTDDSGAPTDFTRRAKYEVSPPGIVTVDDKGLVTAAGDGRATLVARVGGVSASLPVAVERF